MHIIFAKLKKIAAKILTFFINYILEMHKNNFLSYFLMFAKQ